MKPLFWELRLLLRNRVFVILMFSYVLAALIAIASGHQRYEQQVLQNQQVEQHYHHELETWRDGDEPLEAGYVGYYQFVPTAVTPSPWAALFIGEGLEHTWNLRIRLLALYGQIYASEIRHYDNWLLGHFDLAFIWVYLLPVVIGLFAVNTIADEKTSGRWPLLRAQAKSSGHFLRSRLNVLFLLISALNFLILLAAALVLPIAVDFTFASILLMLLAYQLFWFALAYLIARQAKNATFNVLSYCSVWLIVALFLPGMHYLTRMNSDEMNLGITVMMEQREQMNDSWDRDKNADFAKFLGLNPQWRETGALPDAFHWKWYYAMQSMSDAAVLDEVEQLKALRMQAYDSAEKWAWISPVMSLQQTLTSVAGTDGVAHQAYLDQIKVFHQNLQKHFYPHYFFDQPYASARLDEIPRLESQANAGNARTGLIQLIASNAMLLLLILLLQKTRRRSVQSIQLATQEWAKT